MTVTVTALGVSMLTYHLALEITFYLLSEGSINGAPSETCNSGDCQYTTGTDTLEGIGKEKATQIWYRALTAYFAPDTDYSKARKATRKAAEALYKDEEVEAAVQNAWDAVNVRSKKSSSRKGNDKRKLQRIEAKTKRMRSIRSRGLRPN